MNDRIMSEGELGAAIRMVCQTNFGGFDNTILCKSLGVLNPKTPITVTEDTYLAEVLTLFASNNISSVLVVDEAGRLCGIFTERDCIRKALAGPNVEWTRPVSQFMTRNPKAESPDITIAYALNLMAHGGFRHIPLVDSDMHPIGVVSVRDVMQYMADQFMNDLLDFDTSAAG